MSKGGDFFIFTKLKKIPNIVLTLLSGLLLSAAWFKPYTLFIFFAWVPLFVGTNNIHLSSAKKKGLKVWALSYITFFTWNILVTWWVYNASPEGAAMAIVCNALLMSWVYLIWYRIETRLGGGLRFWWLLPLWLAWEYGHTLWDLTWTWLTLGNAFAEATSLVQWYELTGTSGGSLWILVVNVLIAKLLISGRKEIKQWLMPIAAVAVPVVLSFVIAGTRHIEASKKINATIIQPNIDPYDTKFVLDFKTQLEQLHERLLHSKIDKNTELVVLPETFIIDDIIENDYRNSPDLQSLINLMKLHFPKAAILTGACSIHVFEGNETPTSTARKFHNSDRYFDSYNTAIYIDTARNCSFYHKSKLVPGVERMPFPAIFHYFEQFAIDMGGTTGSLATQDERTIFEDNIYDYKLAPAICYESVYSDFMAQYMRKGAQFIGIITNDGWWGNTPGHRQHLSYAKLRAIESRKQIVRCANTGISCFIDEMGAISQAQPYWEFALINQTIGLNDVKTLFVRFGDLISLASLIVTALMIAFSIFLRFRKVA